MALKRWRDKYPSISLFSYCSQNWERLVFLMERGGYGSDMGAIWERTGSDVVGGVEDQAVM